MNILYICTVSYLSPDGVADSGDEVPSKAEVWAQLLCELFGRVFLLGEVPLELVDERDVANVNVQLDDDPLKDGDVPWLFLFRIR